MALTPEQRMKRRQDLYNKAKAVSDKRAGRSAPAAPRSASGGGSPNAGSVRGGSAPSRRSAPNSGSASGGSTPRRRPSATPAQAYPTAPTRRSAPSTSSYGAGPRSGVSARGASQEDKGMEIQRQARSARASAASQPVSRPPAGSANRNYGSGPRTGVSSKGASQEAKGAAIVENNTRRYKAQQEKRRGKGATPNWFQD